MSVTISKPWEHIKAVGRVQPSTLDAFIPWVVGYTWGAVCHQGSMHMLTSAFRVSPVPLQEERIACLFAMPLVSWSRLVCLLLCFSPPMSCLQRGSFKTDPGLLLSLMAPLCLFQMGKITSSHLGHWKASLWVLGTVDLVGKRFPCSVTDALWMAWVEEAASGRWRHWFSIGLYHSLSPNICGHINPPRSY